jgi:hypothetical protein
MLSAGEEVSTGVVLDVVISVSVGIVSSFQGRRALRPSVPSSANPPQGQDWGYCDVHLRQVEYDSLMEWNTSGQNEVTTSSGPYVTTTQMWLEEWMSASVKFSEAIRSQVDERTRSIMTVCEESTATLMLALDQMAEHLVVTTYEDVRELHNNYVRAIMASTAAKEISLTTTLIEAVNKYDFLGYALAARSIVEIVATLRYLLVNRLHPIIHEMTLAGQYDVSHVRRLITEEDIYLRGTRFDWLEFFEKGFQPLNERYAGWLTEKKKDRTAKKWKPGRAAPVEQVGTTTCLEKWAAAQSGVGVLYDLLCDMVHPNIGSVMSTMVPDGNRIRFRVRDPASEGHKLFQYSFPAFMTLTGHEHADSFWLLMQLFLPIGKEAKA